MLRSVWIFILVVILATGLFAPLGIGDHQGGSVNGIEVLGQCQTDDNALSNGEMAIFFIGAAEAG